MSAIKLNKKVFSEHEFLTTLECANLAALGHNSFQYHPSQALALESLKFFLKNFETVYISLDIDSSIHLSIKKVIVSKFPYETEAYIKSLYTYSYDFIYSYLENYPLELWVPLFVDMDLPCTYSSKTISIKYDLILKNVNDSTFVSLCFLSHKDKQILTNQNYFYSKYNLLYNRLVPAINPTAFTFCLFYFPKHSVQNTKRKESFFFLKLSEKILKSSSYEMQEYLKYFISSLAIEKKPCCLNFSCPKRKECYDT
jgi:hypothetical protein